MADRYQGTGDLMRDLQDSPNNLKAYYGEAIYLFLQFILAEMGIKGMGARERRIDETTIHLLGDTVLERDISEAVGNSLFFSHLAERPDIANIMDKYITLARQRSREFVQFYNRFDKLSGFSYDHASRHDIPTYNDFVGLHRATKEELLHKILCSADTDFSFIQDVEIQYIFHNGEKIGLYRYNKEPYTSHYFFQGYTQKAIFEKTERPKENILIGGYGNLAGILKEARKVGGRKAKQEAFQYFRNAYTKLLIEEVGQTNIFGKYIVKPAITKTDFNPIVSLFLMSVFCPKCEDKTWRRLADHYLKNPNLKDHTQKRPLFYTHWTGKYYEKEKTTGFYVDVLAIKRVGGKIQPLGIHHLSTGGRIYPDAKFVIDQIKEQERVLENFVAKNARQDTSKEAYIKYLTDNDMKIFSLYLRDRPEDAFLSIKRILGLFLPAHLPKSLVVSPSYIVGQSGSGKSELLKTLLYYFNTHHKAPCILLDPHGDLADSLDGEDNPTNQNGVAFISRSMGKKGFSKCWKIAPHESRFVVNPFDIDDKSPANRELVAQEITQLMIQMVADTGLSALMETISFPIIYTLLKLPYADFSMFADCIRPSTGQEKLEELRGLVEPHHSGIWADLCGDTYDTTKRSVFNRLQSFLNKRVIGETLNGRDDLGQAMARIADGENLIISLPIPTIGEQASQVLGRFFLTRLQIWAKRRQEIPENQRYPVFLIVDEVQNFLSAETARTLDQFGRKFGLFMVLANQHIKQIEDTQLKGSILANCKNKIVGMSDKATRQALAGEMGLNADDFLSLRAGNFLAKFGADTALKLYAKMVPRLTYQKDENSKEIKPPRPYYAESQNHGESPDGWELAGKWVFRTGGKAEKIKPKYDL